MHTQWKNQELFSKQSKDSHCSKTCQGARLRRDSELPLVMGHQLHVLRIFLHAFPWAAKGYLRIVCTRRLMRSSTKLIITMNHIIMLLSTFKKTYPYRLQSSCNKSSIRTPCACPWCPWLAVAPGRCRVARPGDILCRTGQEHCSSHH